MNKEIVETLQKMRSLNDYKNSIKVLTESDLNLKSFILEQTKNEDGESKIVNDFINDLSVISLLPNVSKTTANKHIKTIQTALGILGYTLPKYGADGILGPETSGSITKFMNDNKVSLNETALDEKASAIRSALSKLGYEEKGNEIDNGGEVNNSISKAAVMVFNLIKERHPEIKIRVTGGNDKYHQKLSYNSRHKFGDAIDFVVVGDSSSKTLDKIVAILDEVKGKVSGFSYIDEYRRPTSAATAPHFHMQIGGKAGGGKVKTYPTSFPSSFIKTLVAKIKEKGFTEKDIVKFNKALKSNVAVSSKGAELLSNKTFNDKIDEISQLIGIDKNSILNVMKHESGLDYTVKNSIGCVGLIQFCPDSKGARTKSISGKVYSLDRLQNDLEYQLDAVKEYWISGVKAGKIREPLDLFTYTFLPIAAGKPDDFVLQSSGLSAELIARQNPVFNRTLGRPISTPLTVGDLRQYYSNKGLI